MWLHCVGGMKRDSVLLCFVCCCVVFVVVCYDSVQENVLERCEQEGSRGERDLIEDDRERGSQVRKLSQDNEINEM